MACRVVCAWFAQRLARRLARGLRSGLRGGLPRGLREWGRAAAWVFDAEGRFLGTWRGEAALFVCDGIENPVAAPPV